MIVKILVALLYGIVEGITEWLPVSSTGHLILLREFVGLEVGVELGAAFADEFWEMFGVVIQLGAILAVAVTFFRALNPFSGSKDSAEKRDTWSIWLKILIASIPAAAAGLLLDKVIEKLTGRDIDGWLYNAWVVSAALIIYGLLFIIIERAHSGKKPKIKSVGAISNHTAFLIGVFQMLAIIPGTSRSGSTILGSILLGVSRTAAAEFSFFMALPAMAGASLIKTYGFFDYIAENSITVPGEAWLILFVASLAAFVVSMISIRFLLDFVKRHTFSSFGIYRIALGAIVLLYFVFA